MLGVVDHCFGDDVTKTYTIRKIGNIINLELKKMCSKNVNSILQQTSTEALNAFQWPDLIEELEEYAPTFMLILKACTCTRHQRPNRFGVIGVCAAMLLNTGIII